MPDTPEMEWFAEWFNNSLYLKVYSHRDNAEAKTCMETILRQTGIENLTPSDIRVMDIACGAGRHALELARRGFTTTANDLSPYLLECTRTQAERENISLECTRQDMRDIKTENAYDLVVQLFSSFGYFRTKEEDLQVLLNVHRALKKNGWYILDLINPVYLKKNFVPASNRTIKGLRIFEKRRIEASRIVKQITISAPDDPDDSTSFEESVRFYELESIQEMLDGAGFTVEKVFGDYEGSVYDDETSARMMIFARKTGNG